MLLRGMVIALAFRSVTAEFLQTGPDWPNSVSLQTAPCCKHIPGDVDWPQPQTWYELNHTVDGRLIATVPVGSVCHVPNYDEDKCAELTANWGQAKIRY